MVQIIWILGQCHIVPSAPLISNLITEFIEKTRRQYQDQAAFEANTEHIVSGAWVRVILHVNRIFQEGSSLNT